MKYELYYLVSYKMEVIDNIAMPGHGGMGKAEQYFKERKGCYVRYIGVIDTFDMPCRKVEQLKLGDS